MSAVNGATGGVEDPSEGIGVQFLKDMKQISLRSLHVNPSERLDFLKLSGAEWLRLFASELIMSSLLGTLWKNAPRPASRPFSPKRHYQLTNWLSGIPFPVGDVMNLITSDESIDSPHRLRKRSFKNYSRQFL